IEFGAPRWRVLTIQGFGRVHVYSTKVLINRENYRQPDYGLGRGQHDHENGEDLSVISRCAKKTEGQIVYVGSVENQLYSHQYADRVAPRQHAVTPEQKEDQPENQKMVQRYSLTHADNRSTFSAGFFAELEGRGAGVSWRDITTAPISAASSNS